MLSHRMVEEWSANEGSIGRRVKLKTENRHLEIRFSRHLHRSLCFDSEEHSRRPCQFLELLQLTRLG
jgi:hypothetical protein